MRPLVILAAAAIGVSQLGCLGADTDMLRQGDPAPEFAAVSLETGDTLSLADLSGQPVLVNLWATWCAPCLTETPYLQSLHEKYSEHGLRIVGVSIDDPDQRVAVGAFVERMGVEYDILLDPEKRSETAFRATLGLPNSILIDRKGKVVFSWFGGVDAADSTFVVGLEQTLGLSR